MVRDLTKSLAKLDKCPAVINWIRFVHDTQPKTTRGIIQFVTGAPKIVYSPAYAAIRDYLNLGVEGSTALRLTETRGAPAGRPQNRELVAAFLDRDKARQYPLCTSIEFEREWFRISRELAIPVGPLTILREKGRFLPIFVCGWSELPLSLMQRRLFMTIVEEAFLSLTDFGNSPAEFVFFPRQKDGPGKGQRKAEVWERGDYVLLSQAELERNVERYLASREEARAYLLAMRAEDERRQAKEEERRSAGDSDALDLFGPKKK